MLVDALEGRILTGCGRCPDTNMYATGIPSHLVVARGLEELAVIVERNNVITIANAKRQHDETISAITELPQLLKASLMENFTIEGVVPMTMSDISRLLADNTTALVSNLTALIDARFNDARLEPENHAAQANINVVEAIERRNELYFWGGKYHMVPEGFIFPSTDVKTMWDLWYFGHANYNGTGQKIRPYKCFTGNGFLSDLNKQEKASCCKVGLVIKKLTELAIENGHAEATSVSTMTRLQSDAAFSSAFPKLIQFLYNAPPIRAADTVCSTVGNLLYVKSKRQRLLDNTNENNENVDNVL